MERRAWGMCMEKGEGKTEMSNGVGVSEGLKITDISNY
jgi:hypothetical protein